MFKFLHRRKTKKTASEVVDCMEEIKSAIIVLNATTGSSLDEIMKVIRSRNQSIEQSTIKTTIRAMVKHRILIKHKKFFKLSKPILREGLAATGTGQETENQAETRFKKELQLRQEKKDKKEQKRQEKKDKKEHQRQDKKDKKEQRQQEKKDKKEQRQQDKKDKKGKKEQKEPETKDTKKIKRQERKETKKTKRQERKEAKEKKRQEKKENKGKKMNIQTKYARCPRPECKAEDLMRRAGELVAKNKDKYDTKEHYIKMLSLVDYTTLEVGDTTEKVISMTTCINDFPDRYPGLLNVAAICVYPAFARLAKTHLKDSHIKVACVSAGFPASQATLQTKVFETQKVVLDGAEEIDVVLPVGKYMEKKYEEIIHEISTLKKICGTRKLKVILEVDVLKDFQLIADASLLAMEAGADFIKTSTGKLTRDVTAFESRFLVMCEAIKTFNTLHGTHIGIKPAGGVRTAEQALALYTIVSEVLGEEYQSNTLFRIGASSLANALLSKITGQEEKYFA